MIPPSAGQSCQWRCRVTLVDRFPLGSAVAGTSYELATLPVARCVDDVGGGPLPSPPLKGREL